MSLVRPTGVPLMRGTAMTSLPAYPISAFCTFRVEASSTNTTTADLPGSFSIAATIAVYDHG